MRACAGKRRSAPAGLAAAALLLWGWVFLGAAPAQAGYIGFIIDEGMNGARDLFPVDLDGDADIDLAATIYYQDQVVWYENNGAEVFTQHVVGSLSNPSAVVAGDLDGDLDLDLAATSFTAGDVVWYENNGSQVFTYHLIDGALDGAEDLVLGHFDSGTTLDLAAVGFNDDIAVWYSNSGGAFVRRLLSRTPIQPESIFATDLDGDGDTDLLGTSFYGDKIFWWENIGGLLYFTERTAVSTVDGPRDVRAADVDGDGDQDIVAGSWFQGQVFWWANDGSETFGTAQTIATGLVNPVSVAVADLDGDTDLDAAVADFNGDQLYWFANDGAENFTQHAVDPALAGAESVVVCDLDGGGDPEILAAGFFADRFQWYAERQIAFQGFTLVDSPSGNGDGSPDPGETLILELQLLNDGGSTLTGVWAQLACDQTAYVTFLDDTADFADIPGGQTATSLPPHVILTIGQDAPCGTALQFSASLHSDQDASSGAFVLLVGASIDDIESGPGDWTHNAAVGIDDWAILNTGFAHSASHAWFATDPGVITDKRLVTPAMAISSGTVFSFWHTYRFETGYDGGLIEISTDGGGNWADIGALITSGNGYDYILNSGYQNPLSGREAWSSGTVGPMSQVEVDLSSFAGSTGQVRFRMGCDSSVPGTGWYIDDVFVEDCQLYLPSTIGCTYTINPLSGTVPFVTQHRVTLVNNYLGITRRMAGRINVRIANGNSYTNWRSGYTNITPGASFIKQWNQTIPALASVIGNNTFTLLSRDVTPSPFNQPPYPPSGDTCNVTNTVVANQP